MSIAVMAFHPDLSPIHVPRVSSSDSVLTPESLGGRSSVSSSRSLLHGSCLVQKPLGQLPNQHFICENPYMNRHCFGCVGSVLQFYAK